ncbi:MAG: hypothetical protein AB1449_07970 [Chloroflexota bacterium]
MALPKVPIRRAHCAPLAGHPPGLVAVPLRDGAPLPTRVYVVLGGMVDVAVHELGARLTRVERLPSPHPARS